MIPSTSERINVSRQPIKVHHAVFKFPITKYILLATSPRAATMADEKRREEFTIDVGDRRESASPTPKTPATPHPVKPSNNSSIPILAYCASSILMTVTNKYVLSGTDFNLNFFLLSVQVGRFSHLKLQPGADYVSLLSALLQSKAVNLPV